MKDKILLLFELRKKLDNEYISERDKNDKVLA